MTRLAIVIINFNRHADTLACLDSLRASTFSGGALVIVLNHETDREDDVQLKRAYPGVELIALPVNAGFAGNNNVGIQRALALGAEWVLVLNEDTVLDPACLSEMLTVANSDKKIGIVGPTVYHYDEPNVIQSAGGALDGLWRPVHEGQNEVDRGQYEAPREVAWVSGCAFLVRRALIKKLGALDERFFCYYEETDWCLRAAAAGWRIMHAPAARMWHKGVRRDYRPRPYVAYYMTRNRMLFLSKHGAPFLARTAAWIETLRTLVSYSLRERWRTVKREERGMIWRGLRDYVAGRWGEMPTT
jgi:GT2 family glycosyltransferase